MMGGIMSNSFHYGNSVFAVSVAVIGAVGSGCTTVPPLPKEAGNIPISDVVDRIKCEVHDAGHEEWKDWKAGVDLTLIVNTQSGITPGVSFINPLVQAVDKARGTFSQSFSLAAGGTLNGLVTRTDTVSFDIDFAQDYTTKCDKGIGGITGELGLSEWLHSVSGIKEKGVKYNFNNPKSFGHTVDFIVTMNAGVTPSWSLVHFKGPGGGASASGGTSGGASGTTGGGSNGSSGSFLFASRQETHRLQITMVSPAPPMCVCVPADKAKGHPGSPTCVTKNGLICVAGDKLKVHNLAVGIQLGPTVREMELERQRMYNATQQLINALTPK
jgi:hypothetical protein